MSKICLQLGYLDRALLMTQKSRELDSQAPLFLDLDRNTAKITRLAILAGKILRIQKQQRLFVNGAKQTSAKVIPFRSIR